MQVRLSRRIVFLQYFGFFIIGLICSMIGPLIPFIRSDLDLSYSAAGLLFSAQSAGSLVILILSGWLIHVYGKRKLLVAGAISFTAGLLVSATAASAFALLAGNILIGIGTALFDVGISTLCLDTNPEGKGKALNLLHFFFGAGCVAGPMLALVLSTVPGGWRLAFAISASGPGLILIMLAFIRLPSAPRTEVKKKFVVYKRPLLWWSALTICLYCGVEWGIGAWFPSYWKESAFVGNFNPALATSLFWLTFSAGRFLIGPWADKWGFRRFLGISFAATLVLAILWLIFPNPGVALILVLIIGFVIAGQYPTVVALASQKFPASSGQVASFLSVFGSIGTFIWPPAIGAFADFSGIGILAPAELVLAVGMILLGLMAFAADRKQPKL